MRLPVGVRSGPVVDALAQEPAPVAAARLGERPWPDIYAGLHRDLPAEPVSFPMYGIPRDEIVALMSVERCAVFHIEPDDRALPEWNAYRYFVRKGP